MTEALPLLRRFVEQFAAYRWDGSGLAQEMVRDISSTGLFLLTKERWQPGTILTLTLQREGPLDLDPARVDGALGSLRAFFAVHARSAGGYQPPYKP